MLTKILVPLDGSELASRALPRAVQLAHAADAQVVLVRAAFAHPLVGVDEVAAQSAVVDEAETALGEVAARLRQDGLTVETSVYYEEAAAAILDATKRRHADLIVMTTHGRSGLGRWIYGSVADRVLQRSEVPVLLVPPAAEQPWPTDRALRILVPLDGSALAEEALEASLTVDAAPAAELILARVVPSAVPVLADPAYLGAYDTDAEEAEARGYLEALAATARARGRAVQVLATTGVPATALVAIAQETGADLIAMATHGRGGLARLVLGSVATGVLQRTHVPLLVVRPTHVRASAAAAPTVTATDSGLTVTVTLTPRELELVRLGLEELGQGVRDDHLAAAVADLHARLRQAAPAPSKVGA